MSFLYHVLSFALGGSSDSLLLVQNDFLWGTGYLRRANNEHLKEIFYEYASAEKNGKKFMAASDFLCQFLGMYTEDSIAQGLHRPV